MNVINIDEEGRFGGPERRIVNVARELKAIGVNTVVFMPFMDSVDFEKFATENQVNYRKLDITRLTLEKKVLFRYLYRFVWELLLLRKEIIDVSPDLVHVNGAYQFKSVLAAVMSGVNVVWHLNNESAHSAVKLIFDLLNKFVPFSCIVSSDGARQYFIPEVSDDRVVTRINPPVDVDDFMQKKTYQPVGKAIKIGTVTNVSPQKDVITFVKTAHKIKEMCDMDVKFVIGGPVRDSQKTYFRKVTDLIELLGMEKNIEFVGFVSDVPGFLGSFDIYLNTSAWEAGPMSVWEALAAGMPVVTTDVGTTKYHVGELGAGFVAEVGDYNKLSELTVQLIENQSIREKYGMMARKVACDYLSVGKAAILHKEHYNNAIKG